MGCRLLVDKKVAKRGRCGECAKAIKDERNRQHRNLGPCPQEGVCVYCKGLYGPPTPSNEFVWGHWPVRFIDGGTEVAPIHRRCNESLQKRNHQPWR